MNEIKIFNNPDFGEIRTVVIDGEPWFAGKDVAAALGYARPTDAARNNTDNDDKGVSEIATPSGTQKMLVINESGLYSLIFGSKLDSAKKFKKWVTSEVLPSIRRTGAYGTPQLPAEPMEMLKIHYAALEQVDHKVSDVGKKVDTLEQRFNKFEDELPVTGADIENIQSAVRKKGLQSLGGKESSAYKDQSTRTYVYADIQCELRRQFGVKRYKEIKHKDVQDAIRIIVDYKLPIALKNRVDMVNAQESLDLEGGAGA